MQGKRAHPVRHAPRFGEALTLDDYPDAPRGAFVCDEGWLVVGQEAWTLREWLRAPTLRPAQVQMGRPPKYATEAERLEAKRRSGREYMRRLREKEWAAR